MGKRRRKAVCPRCFELKLPTRHHIYVKRFYGENPYIIFLCRDCHTRLEKILASKEMDRKGQLKKWEYLDIVRSFLKGGCYV